MALESKQFHPELFPLRHFRRIFRDGSSMLPRADDWRKVLDPDHAPKLLLDYYTEQMVVERLEHHGVLPRLRAGGLDNILVRLNLSDPGRQQVIIYRDKAEFGNIIAEISLHKGTFSPHADFTERLRYRRFPMLYVQWLRLQDPRRPFTPSRPALPGQRHPGLKVGHEVMRTLVALGSRLKLEGIINIPEFPHAAVLYSRRFHFFDPRIEGLLQAIQRDLSSKSLSQASWAIQLGCVRKSGETDPFYWFREEQVLPLSERWERYFKGERYNKTVTQSRDSSSFIFDEEKWDRLQPLNPDGSPKEEFIEGKSPAPNR